MLVFWEQRLALLATPKTGSTAIAAALEPLASLSIQRPPELKHTTVQRFRRFLGPYLNLASGHEFEVVAMMREPEAWLGSWFRFRGRSDITDARRSTAGISFDDFVSAWCEPQPPPHADVGRQSVFLRPRHGLGADRLFAYEDIGALVTFLEDRLGCEIVLPRLNVSPEAEMTLSAGTRRRLREVAAEDYALYAGIAGG